MTADRESHGQPDDLDAGPDDGDPSLDPTVGSTALEKLCVAIIRANPDRDPKSSRTSRQRLRDAVYALQGHHPARGDHAKDDLDLLLRMAEALNALIAADETVRTAANPAERVAASRRLIADVVADSKRRRSLARQALAEAGLPPTKKDLKRLAGKFEGEWRALLNTLALASPTPHAGENRHMAEVVPLLQKMGIAADMPPDPGLFWPMSSD
jgi:hypothetical protein